MTLPLSPLNRASQRSDAATGTWSHSSSGVPVPLWLVVNQDYKSLFEFSSCNNPRILTHHILSCILFPKIVEFQISRKMERLPHWVLNFYKRGCWNLKLNAFPKMMDLRPEGDRAASPSTFLVQGYISVVCYLSWLQVLLRVHGVILVSVPPAQARMTLHAWDSWWWMILGGRVNSIHCLFFSPRTDTVTQNPPVLEDASRHVTFLLFSRYSSVYHANWTRQTNHVWMYLRFS